MRIFFEKMMLDHPGMVIATAVGGLQLRQRVGEELEVAAGLPGARQLQRIKDAEFHDVTLLPRSACCFQPVYSLRKPSLAKSCLGSCLASCPGKNPVSGQFGVAEAGLRWWREWLVLLSVSRRQRARPSLTETPCPPLRRIRIPR